MKSTPTRAKAAKRISMPVMSPTEEIQDGSKVDSHTIVALSVMRISLNHINPAVVGRVGHESSTIPFQSDDQADEEPDQMNT